MQIDFVSPPFAGHLFPQLELAAGLQRRGIGKITVCTAETARRAVELSGLAIHRLLAGREREVFAIADTPQRVGANPLRLLRQFRGCLALLGDLQAELRARWETGRPDLVIVDMTLPVAGWLARSMGIAWWTSLPTICVLETGDGAPSYVGGWRPWPGLGGRIRDAAGRALVSTFKRLVFRAFRRPLAALGGRGVYRPDGSEDVYSPDTILGLGVREFEFPRRWPEQLLFVGPCTASPPFPHVGPSFREDRPHVLVSLGTHVAWAKPRARELFREVARRMPGVEIHFSNGIPGGNRTSSEGNFHEFDYLPYDLYASRYRAAVVHGGTGLTYAFLKRGVPLLVWPQDYDQFDHAARIVEGGWGLRLRTGAGRVAVDLARLIEEPAFSSSAATMAGVIGGYRTVELVADRIEAERMRSVFRTRTQSL